MPSAAQLDTMPSDLSDKSKIGCLAGKIGKKASEEEIESIAKAFEKVTTASQSLWDEADRSAPDDDASPLVEAAAKIDEVAAELIKKAANIQSSTPDEILAKVRMYFWCRGGEPVDSSVFDVWRAGEPATDVRILVSIIADLQAMATR